VPRCAIAGDASEWIGYTVIILREELFVPRERNKRRFGLVVTALVASTKLFYVELG